MFVFDTVLNFYVDRFISIPRYTLMVLALNRTLAKIKTRGKKKKTGRKDKKGEKRSVAIPFYRGCLVVASPV